MTKAMKTKATRLLDAVIRRAERCKKTVAKGDIDEAIGLAEDLSEDVYDVSDLLDEVDEEDG
jgi:hypothetical protein